MRNLFQSLYLLLAGIVIICTIVKSIYFRNAGRSGVDDFIQSFFRWYSSYRMYDTSSETKRLYMRTNNRVNIVWWAALLSAVACFVFYKLVFK
ncbi:hypothetical protein [Foetidibacter luteolus]|uniref:hypothetical protein n=1 Tax=Foetidibacter luteolus TaxID=2608880 RepID=UPI00129AC80C|nr:hypothetical protein [Foetidibacter luteolus]